MTDQPQRFEGTNDYIATDDLKVAVDAAVMLRRPLLVKGEPGTGKTVLAHEIAKAIGAPLIEWNVKSTTKAQQGLYEYDAVARLRDGQLGDERVHDIANYIKKGKLWEAFTSKELPDAFLRRCFFHYIKFPDRDTMRDIIEVHYPGIQKNLVSKAMDIFYELRDVPGLKKKPSTSELLDWLKLLLNEDMPMDVLQDSNPNSAIPPLHGALLKNEQDVMMFERLAFMARRNPS